MLNPIEQFRNAIRATGIAPPETIKADGVIHRFSSNGKHDDDAGWYLLHGDGIPAGSFGDWRTGVFQNWRSDIGRALTPMEEAQHRAKAETMKREREAEEIKRRDEARAKAAAIWQNAEPLPTNHPYLIRKHIKPSGARLYKDRLVIPVRAGGELHSLQFIDGDGDKRFLTGGRVADCYFSIGNPDGGSALCIAEGFATGASIHEATGYPVAVAFNAGNLEGVAKTMREKFPNHTLILCADDDHFVSGNPGLTKATEAAQAVNGLLAVPDFGVDRPEKVTDFNDMALLDGLDAVKRAIENASEAAREKPSPELENASEAVLEGQESDDARIKRLSSMKPLQYDRVRKDEAKAMGVRPETLDKQVKQARQTKDGDEAPFEEVEPWPVPIHPEQLLDEVLAIIQRFIICEPETAQAAALWIAMTWVIHVVQVAPLAVITAPEKRCGKSQLLFLMGRIVNRPLSASNITPAALFRSIDAWAPTLLIDEADAFMTENEELRGLLNCGHTRESAYTVRLVGDEHTPKRFNVWGAKALAGIGRLADTLMDRSITLELRRKLPHEQVDRLRHAESGLFETIRAKLARFAEDYAEAVSLSRADLPMRLNDRAQDNWEPLLAIADVAGGKWPEMARAAAIKLSGEDNASQSIGVELLTDIREVFELKQVERLSTIDLLNALIGDDLKPWATYNRGKEMKPRQLAKRLGEYGIQSRNIRCGYNDVRKGYELKQFEDAFSRYISPSPNTPAVSATPLQPHNSAASDVADKQIISATLPQYPLHRYNSTQSNTSNVADNPLRSGMTIASATPQPAWLKDCSVVADKKGNTGVSYPATKSSIRI